MILCDYHEALESVAEAARRVLPSVNDPSLFDTLRKALAALDETGKERNEDKNED